jgi:proteic killer suppression protein
VILSIKNKGTVDIFNGLNSQKARSLLPQNLHKIAQRKLDIIDASTCLNDLKAPPSNHLEQLKGDRSDQYSIRINSQYRICFKWAGTNAVDVEIVDYHYPTKDIKQPAPLFLSSFR